MIIRLWVLPWLQLIVLSPWARLLKTDIVPSPARWTKKKCEPACSNTGKVKQTRLCRRSGVPYNKNYIVKSGLNVREIEMGTTAEHLEFRFWLYLLMHFKDLNLEWIYSWFKNYQCLQSFVLPTWDHTSCRGVRPVIDRLFQSWYVERQQSDISVQFRQ